MSRRFFVSNVIAQLLINMF